MHSHIRFWGTSAVLLAFAGCGGGGYGGGGNSGSGGGGGGGGGPTYTVGGTVTGLSGTGLTLQLNTTRMTVGANGAFTFTPALTNGTEYTVTVANQPTTPAQTCNVDNRTGRVNGANVTNVSVTCTTAPMTLVTSTPVSGATAVERTIAPVLTFSVPLDATTATATTVSLTGPAGELPVTVAASGNQLTVTLSKPLATATPYTLAVGTNLHGSAGEPLAAPLSVTFSSRDGVWQDARLIEMNDSAAVSPEIAASPNGDAVAIWKQLDPVTTVWTNRYTAGTGWGTPELLSGGGAARDPHVAVDGHGDAFAIWSEVDPQDHHDHIQVRRFSAGAWGPAQRGDVTASIASEPQLVADPNGDAIAIWTQVEGSQPRQVWARHYTADVGWDSPLAVGSSMISERPLVGMDAQGNALAIWTQGATSPSQDLWASRFTAANMSWGTPVPLDAEVSTITDPRLSVNAHGDAVVVWGQVVANSEAILSRRFTIESDWGAVTPVNTALSGIPAHPQIVIDPKGNALAVWDQKDAAGVTRVWANSSSSGGQWGEPKPLDNNQSIVANFAHIAVDVNGNAVAAWLQEDSHTSVWTNRYVAGRGWGEAKLAETNVVGDALSEPQVALDGNGNALVVWDQEDPDTSLREAIWAARFE